MPRCGSTTLRRLLNCHPRIRCLEEPFNPFNHEGRYLARASDPAALDAVLRDIWRAHTGIKHTCTPDGWPFIGNPSLNLALLLRPGQKVIYLRRRNLLRRLVSVHISNQTGIWGLFDEARRKAVRSFAFAPMDVDFVRAQLQRDSSELSHHRRLLTDSSADFIEVYYEDMYDPGKTPAERVHVLNRLFRFLGVPALTDATALVHLHALFDPVTMKLNSSETYRRIPGIAVVDEACGSDELGWLFDG